MYSTRQAEAARECGGCANDEHCGFCKCCTPKPEPVIGKVSAFPQPVQPASARAAHVSPERAKSRTAKPKKESRAKRWARLTSEAAQIVDELTQLQSEFEEWRDNLPENFESSPLGEKLALICDLDLQGALETLQEAENTDAPLGFGRD